MAIKSYNNSEEQFRRLEAIEQMTRTQGWPIFLDWVKKEQESYIKKARDKKIQFSGDKIALFMACEGVLDSVANWANKQLNSIDTVRNEAMLHRNSQEDGR